LKLKEISIDLQVSLAFHTSLVREIKIHVKTLPSLGIPSDNTLKIVVTNASKIGFGGILKKLFLLDLLNKLFLSIPHPRIMCKLIKKENLSVVLCITKFQSDLLNQKFLLHIDCKFAKYILKKRCLKHCIKTKFR
jgi:hypothetical protein